MATTTLIDPGQRSTRVTEGIARTLEWSGLQPSRFALQVGGAAGALTPDLAAAVGPGYLVVVDPDPQAVDGLRGRLADAGLHATVLEGHPGMLPVLSNSVELTWVEAIGDDLDVALHEAARVTRPGGTVVVRQAERRGCPPLVQADQLGDCLAVAGFEDVETLVTLELAPPIGVDGEASAQIATTLRTGLPTARVLQLRLAAVARGRVT